MTDKPKILSLLQLPPPMHGAAAVNNAIAQSDHLNNLFDQDCVPIQLSFELKNVGFFAVSKLFRTFINVTSTLKAINRQRPDLVYFTLPPHGGGFYASIPLVIILKLFRLKILYHFHGKGFGPHAEASKIYRALIRWATSNTFSILLSKRLLLDACDQVKSTEIFFVPNFGPDVNDIQEKSASGAPHLIFLSNLVLTKGPIEFLNALKLLDDRGVDFRTTFAGNAHRPLSSDKFSDEIRSRGLSGKVHYAGPVYGEAKDKLLRSADILVLPTRYPNEAFPLVVLEAMSYGLAIVATPEGAIPDMVEHEENGFLVNALKSDELANAIERLIINPDLRKQMGISSQRKIREQFSKNVFDDRIAEIWTQLAGPKGLARDIHR